VTPKQKNASPLVRVWEANPVERAKWLFWVGGKLNNSPGPSGGQKETQKKKPIKGEKSSGKFHLPRTMQKKRDYEGVKQKKKKGGYSCVGPREPPGPVVKLASR